jgi:hypothetical protein
VKGFTKKIKQGEKEKGEYGCALYQNIKLLFCGGCLDACAHRKIFQQSA